MKNDFIDDEIDLRVVGQKAGEYFANLNRAIFNTIQFFIRKKYIILLLLVMGIGIGFFLDTNNKKYDHQIIVTPNFGSIDYLYSKIRLLNSKIEERDTLFLKSLGFTHPDRLSKIVVKPLVDIYGFINRNKDDKNFDLLKLMAEDGDINKIVEDPVTSKNYYYHVISFSTRKMTTRGETVDPLMKFLNSSNYYSRLQKEYINNISLKMRANDVIISQIDSFLNSFGNADQSNKSDKLVYYNENTQLNDVINTKDRLITEQARHRVELVGLEKIVKEISNVTNIENNEAVNGKLKLVLPIALIICYILVYSFVAFYRNESKKAL